MASVTYKLGALIHHEGKEWRIIRIVNQHCLFLTNEGNEVTVTEDYLELKSAEGEIDFLQIGSVDQTEGVKWDPATICPPTSITWEKGK